MKKTVEERTIKVFARRDSATGELRKMGISKENYSKFISAVGDKFHCDIAKAALSLVVDTKTITKKTVGRPTPIEKPDSKKPATLEDREKVDAVRCTETTASGMTRKMILDGHTNADIFIELQINFGLTDDKNHYPAWYRSQLCRAIGVHLVPTNREAQYYKQHGGMENCK